MLLLTLFQPFASLHPRCHRQQVTSADLCLTLDLTTKCDLKLVDSLCDEDSLSEFNNRHQDLLHIHWEWNSSLSRDRCLPLEWSLLQYLKQSLIQLWNQLLYHIWWSHRLWPTARVCLLSDNIWLLTHPEHLLANLVEVCLVVQLSKEK